MAKKKLTFRMHGLTANREAVSADQFARKLGALVRGLKKADKLGHGKYCLDFLITDLKMGSAQAEIVEAQANVKHIPYSSGIEKLYRAMRAVSEEAGSAGLNGSKELLPEIRSLSLHASKRFSHIDFFVDDNESEAIRIDNFFADQVVRIAKAIKKAEDKSRTLIFKGRSKSTFDGTLKVVDHRGAKNWDFLC